MVQQAQNTQMRATGWSTEGVTPAGEETGYGAGTLGSRSGQTHARTHAHTHTHRHAATQTDNAKNTAEGRTSCVGHVQTRGAEGNCEYLAAANATGYQPNKNHCPPPPAAAPCHPHAHLRKKVDIRDRYVRWLEHRRPAGRHAGKHTGRQTGRYSHTRPCSRLKVPLGD